MVTGRARVSERSSWKRDPKEILRRGKRHKDKEISVSGADANEFS